MPETQISENDVRSIAREELDPDLDKCPDCGAVGRADLDLYCRGCGRLFEERWFVCRDCRHLVRRHSGDDLPRFCPRCGVNLVPITPEIAALVQ